MLKQAKDLLSFKAFKPSKRDVKVPLMERFYKEGPIMGVSLSKHCLTCAEIEFTNQSEISVSKVKTFPINCEEQEAISASESTTTPSRAEEDKIEAMTLFARENNLSHVVLLHSPEIQIVKLETASNKIGVDRLYDAKHTISETLGEEPEEGRAYAYVGNPKFDETLIFSYDQAKIEYTVNLLISAGLEVVRAVCSIYGIIDYLVNDRPEFLSHNQILLIYNSDCLVIASICENRFQQIGFRARIAEDEIASCIPRMIERFECEHNQVSYVNCSNWDTQTYFSQNYPSLKMVPVFPDSLKGMFQAASYG